MLYFFARQAIKDGLCGSMMEATRLPNLQVPQARNLLNWFIFLLQCMVKSQVSPTRCVDSSKLWTAAHQAHCLQFSNQEPHTLGLPIAFSVF